MELYSRAVCPPGTKSDTTNINGTLFLICVPRDSSFESEDGDLIGAIVGGICSLTILMLAIYYLLQLRQELRRFQTKTETTRQVSPEEAFAAEQAQRGYTSSL